MVEKSDFFVVVTSRDVACGLQECTILRSARILPDCKDVIMLCLVVG